MARKAKGPAYSGPKRAAIYVRVSSDEQALHGTSLQSQRDDLTAHVEAQGWVVAGVWEDAGISGAKRQDDRPALKALMAAVKAGQVDVVVVDKWDRLARNLNAQTTLWGELDDLGVEYVSRSEPASSGPDGRFVRNIMAAVAEQERERIRARTTGGRIARIRNGGWSGGEPPLGFRVQHDSEGRNARLVLNNREADMLRRAVTLLLDQRMTTGEAAQALNVEGFVPRKAPRWTAALLRNHLMRSPLGGRWTYAKPSTRLKGLDLLPEPVTVDVPRILDPERHAALLGYLKATTSPKTRTHVHPLSGLLVGECGHAYQGVARRDRGRRRYRCGYSKDTGRGWTCDGKTVLAEDLDRAVWAEVVRVLRDPSLLQAAAVDALGVLDGTVAAETDALGKAEAEVVKCQTALAGAMVAGLKQGLDSATLDQVVSDLKRDLAEATNRVQAISAMREQTSAQRQGLEAVQALVLEIEDRMEDPTPEFMSEVFRALGVEVRVPEAGPEGEPLKVAVTGTDVLGLLSVSAGQEAWACDRGVLSLENRTSR